MVPNGKLTNGDVAELGLNNPDVNYWDKSCKDCKNYTDCPQKIKAWHNFESAKFYERSNLQINSAVWCMGSNGYKHFR